MAQKGPFLLENMGIMGRNKNQAPSGMVFVWFLGLSV
jgi:hypothetical protein